MFATIGIFAGFAILAGLLWLVDWLAYQRGFGGADPLSPAVAYALLLGTALMLALFIGGIMLDRAAEVSAPPSPTQGSK